LVRHLFVEPAQSRRDDAGRGATIDHSTIHRWTLIPMPVLEKTFQKRKAIVFGVDKKTVLRL